MKIYCVSKNEEGELFVEEVEATDRGKQYWLEKEAEGFGYKKRIFKDKTHVSFTPEDAIKFYKEKREERKILLLQQVIEIEQELEMAKGLKY